VRAAFFHLVDDELEGLGPRLYFIRRDELNPVRPNYTKQSIEHIAQELGQLIESDLPVELIRPLGRKGSFVGTLAATVLRALANNPEALAALNHSQETESAEILGLNRAVHYLTRVAINGSKAKKVAKYDVAEAWGRTDGQIKDDHTKHGKAAQRSLEAIIEYAMSETVFGYSTREAVLTALDSDMHHRAKLMRGRRKSKKLSA